MDPQQSPRVVCFARLSACRRLVVHHLVPMVKLFQLLVMYGDNDTCLETFSLGNEEVEVDRAPVEISIRRYFRSLFQTLLHPFGQVDRSGAVCIDSHKVT